MDNKTTKIYYENCYTSVFNARVVSCDEREVVLDKTAFYPEGGGQPCDLGIIGNAQVLGVYEKDGKIVHITDKSLNPNETVSGSVDFKRRFVFMQNHTGEHIVSGIANRLYKVNNVGFHMSSELVEGKGFVTVDFDGFLNAAQLREIEKLANKAVYSNARVSECFPNEEEIKNIEYRSKKELDGEVRIVTVEGHDSCACCGLHCATAGEVGIIKIIYHEKYKGGVRVYMICGEHALDDYISKNEQIYKMSALLSSKPEEINLSVARLHAENAALKRKFNEIKTELLKYKASDASVLENEVALAFENGINGDELRMFCGYILENSGVSYAAVFSKTEEDNVFKYSIASKTEDIRILGMKINAELNGRGGGQPLLFQGSVTANESEIREVVSAWK